LRAWAGIAAATSERRPKPETGTGVSILGHGAMTAARERVSVACSSSSIRYITSIRRACSKVTCRFQFLSPEFSIFRAASPFLLPEISFSGPANVPMCLLGKAGEPTV
jgi:hypothetical protein